MTSNRRLIFITSLERSGSTILDITLGRHPQLVSFGEVARVLMPHDDNGIDSVIKRPCSCGKIVENCPFWGKITKSIKSHEIELSLAERYGIFMSHFDNIYGKDFIPIDSSKYINAMVALHELNNTLDLRILFTIRDVRGWLSSARRADKYKREVPYGLIFSSRIVHLWKAYLRHNVLRHIPFWLPLEWYFRNRIIDRFIRQKSFSIKQLSYERFVLENYEVLADIYRFIGIKSQPVDDQSKSHIVRGNRMAFVNEKNIDIRYDTKWLTELWTQYEPMIWPFVMVKNKKWVYEIK